MAKVKSKLITTALDYAKLGWKLFPLATLHLRQFNKQRFDHATTDPGKIKKYFTQYPYTNIAVVTGKASGIFVLDNIARYGGDASLQALEAEFGPLPKTVRQITSDGGDYLFFNYPKNITIQAHPEALGPGLRVKGDDDFIVLEPATSTLGYPFLFDSGHHPKEMNIADAPEWLLNRLQAEAPPELMYRVQSYVCNQTTTEYGCACFEAEKRTFLDCRGYSLAEAFYSFCFNVSRLVQDGHIFYESAWDALLELGDIFLDMTTYKFLTTRQIVSIMRRAFRQPCQRIYLASEYPDFSQSKF